MGTEKEVVSLRADEWRWKKVQGIYTEKSDDTPYRLAISNLNFVPECSVKRPHVN
jgi:hypothetical protein